MTEEVAHPIIRTSIPVRAFDNFDDVAGLVVFPDRRRMAASSNDGFLRVWNLKDGVILKEMNMLGQAIRDILLSRDGKWIASCDCGGYVVAWHGDTFTEAFRTYGSNVSSLDFSPDGAMLAICSYKSTGLWNTKKWQQQGEPLDTTSYSYSRSTQASCVRYSPDGELLAIATESNIQIWNPVTQRLIANLDVYVHTRSLVWKPDGTRLLSAYDSIVRVWDSSTWKEVGRNTSATLRKSDAGPSTLCIAINFNGTLFASPTTNNHVCLFRLSDQRVIAIFRHSDSPCSVAFSMDGKHILAGGKDKKISEWAIPEHAWPETAQTCDVEVQDYDAASQDSDSKILIIDSTLRKACITGDLSAAEELLTQEIDAKGDCYRSYANRSVVMARKLDWDHALDDATKSLGIQPSFMGYVSKGIALCGKNHVRNANKAFDFASTFTDGDPSTNHFLFLVKAMALFNANLHVDAMRRVQELAVACPNADTVFTCRILEVYLHIQRGNIALDRACPAEAANHFTSAVNTGTFLIKLATHPKYDDFVVLFGCDFTSLWQTANQKRCHALLRAGRLAEVFEAYRYMADMSDETMKASCLDWSVGFMQELSGFHHNASNVDATPDMCKYDDENDSISDIDSNIDHVDDLGC